MAKTAVVAARIDPVLLGALCSRIDSGPVRRGPPLFAGFDYSLSLQAAIDGTSPGRIFVDDVSSPRTGLALTVEGYLLAGEHDDRGSSRRCAAAPGQHLYGKVYVNATTHCRWPSILNRGRPGCRS